MRGAAQDCRDHANASHAISHIPARGIAVGNLTQGEPPARQQCPAQVRPNETVFSYDPEAVAMQLSALMGLMEEGSFNCIRIMPGDLWRISQGGGHSHACCGAMVEELANKRQA
jgi:hypothetical protein